jgi:amino acid transporter
MSGPTEPAGSRDPFIRALGLGDVIVMNVVAVVGLRWIARGARIGAPSVTLWVLAWLAFFVPLAAAVCELSSRYPEQGGLYAWTRRAFGPVHGFICGWCLWINNLFYFPSLLLFGAANALLVFGDRFDHLADSRAYSAVFVLAGVWLCTGLNIAGLNAGKWLQNLGSVGTWVPAGLLIGCGAVAFAWFGSATSFAPRDLVPRDDFLSTLGLWSAMCFAFSGFEITALVGQEVRDPRRTIPRGVLIAGLATTAIYILGSSSVLVAVPASALAERSGISDAVDLVSARVGLAGLGGLTGALLAVGALAGTNSWTAGAARVPFAAGVDRVLPAAFGRIHQSLRTPHVALVVQGLVSSALFLASVFLTISGESTSVQEAYDILVNLTILIYFIPYLYLFAALPRLRRIGPPAGPDVMLVWGGRFGLWLMAVLGFTATMVSLGLLFVPPAGTANVINYEANLILQAAVILAVGAGFYVVSRRPG